MARSLIGGLIADGCQPQNIWVADPDPMRLSLLHQQFGVATTADNREAAQQAHVIVLAVKPQVMETVTHALADTVQQRQPLMISIAAGVREPDIRRWLGGDVAVVRTMPNTPALVGSAATALFANRWVSDSQRQLAESILHAVGLTLWVHDESQLDVVTALSGSGPAYFFLIMEVLTKAGQQMGLSAEDAELLTLQTALGAAKMALESDEKAALLRQRVTSPGGTTERAIQVLQKSDLEGLLTAALMAARQRAQELGEQLGGHRG